MMNRWLVVYYDGNGTKAKLIDAEDFTPGENPKFPYGVEPSDVADDCEDITAIVLVGNDTNVVPLVVIDDEPFQFPEAEGIPQND